METFNRPVRVLGHPVHQMLVVFPLGLLATAVVFDAIHVFGGSATFGQVGYWNITAGLVGGVLAAVFGLVDWLTIPSGTRAKRVGLLHGVGNAVVVVAFFVSWLVRTGGASHVPTVPLFVLEVVAALVASGTAWLGGELVDRLGIGVDRGANPDAPSSLSDRTAHA
jgi:uncharacterized membrane protein